MLNEPDPASKEKLKPIRLLLMDVDGVLTDGSITYTEDDTETKRFYARDGLGIQMLHRHDIRTGVVTGRSSSALLRRLRELEIRHIYADVRDKEQVLDRITADTGCRLSEIAFIGDDLVDLPVFQKIAVGIAVSDAHAIIREHADIITAAAGGRGAVREVCEMLLQAKGLWRKELRHWM
jgi:3-deoxy-D-manno-octulosonate 8-phosphate phosphatase (KDO 8-P phosphatase)